jgi:response regulator of citrate/malate metabolism
VSECYRQGANGYQVKPVDYERLRRDVQRTVEYWFDTAVIPTPGA